MYCGVQFVFYPMILSEGVCCGLNGMMRCYRCELLPEVVVRLYCIIVGFLIS